MWCCWIVWFVEVKKRCSSVIVLEHRKKNGKNLVQMYKDYQDKKISEVMNVS